MQPKRINRSGFSIELGIGFVLVGIGLLAYRLFPEMQSQLKYIFNIPMLLIALGVTRGVNTKFKTNDWWILLLIGVVNYLFRYQIIEYRFMKIVMPLFLIIIGIAIIIKRKNQKIKAKNQITPFDDIPILPYQNMQSGTTINNEQTYQSAQQINNDDLHILNVETIFGSNSRVVISKNFQGGNASCIFGSVTVYLNKADIHGTITIQNFCIFGEITIIVPANFNIINNITSALGSVEDKRNFLNETSNQKTIILKGHVLFGSINIKNF